MRLSEAQRLNLYRCLCLATCMPVPKEKIDEWGEALGYKIPTRYSYHLEGIPYYCVTAINAIFHKEAAQIYMRVTPGIWQNDFTPKRETP